MKGRGTSLTSENGNMFRQKRFAGFLALVDALDIGDRPVRILDLGGAMQYWEALRPLWDGRNLDILIINLDRQDEDHPPHYRLRAGNACALPEYADGSFDIVHSNSVIEHVGHWREMQAMASEVRRLAKHYFVQTPNLWFPLEAHYRVPFMQFLPEETRARMLLRKKRGYVDRQDNLTDAMREVQSINLLTETQMRALFPDARIERERIFGMTKSITAIR